MGSDRKRRLGKGLDALLSARPAADLDGRGDAPDETRVLQIDPHTVKPNPKQPRRVFQEEALQELKSELPGQLTGLGVDREQIEEIQSVLDGLVVTLEPVQNLQSALAAIAQGRFGDAFKEIDEIQKLWDPACKTDPKVKKKVEAALEAWKAATIATIRKIPVSLRDLLHLSPEITGVVSFSYPNSTSAKSPTVTSRSPSEITTTSLMSSTDRYSATVRTR